MPVEGNPSSSVRVIIYEDLQCSDCAVFREMLDADLLPKYGAKVAFEHRDFPLHKHAWARTAAVASRALAASNPKLYVEWRRYALAHRKEIKADTFNDKLLAWARQHGADTTRLIAALEDKALNDAVDHDYQDGIARGVSKTPTVFVDGEPFVETFTLAEISAALDKAIK
jgi:protein-disulfide isomerase